MWEYDVVQNDVVQNGQMLGANTFLNINCFVCEKSECRIWFDAPKKVSNVNKKFNELTSDEFSNSSVRM